MRVTSVRPSISDMTLQRRERRNGKVEDGRGSLGPMADAGFRPLVPKPNVPISGIRLSDWFTVRHAASELTASGFGTVGHSPSPRDTAVSTAPVLDGVLRLIANHHDLPIFECAPEVRVLSSTGVTRLQRSS